MTSRGQEELFHLGVIVGTHGLRGDLKVRTLSADSTSLQGAEQVTLRWPNGRSEVCRPQRTVPHKGGWLLRLQGRETVEAARELVGCDVLMRYADLPPTDEDEFYWYQLQGLTVIDRTRGELGTLTDLLTTAAHDIYVVTGPHGEVLVPAVAEFVLEIDPEAGRMTVDLPEGLVDQADEV